MTDQITLTGNPSTDQFILEELDSTSLLNLCSTHPYIQSLCNEEFFQTLTWNRFGPNQRPDDLTWKDWYLSLDRYIKPDEIEVREAIEDDRADVINYIHSSYPELTREIIIISLQQYNIVNIVNWILDHPILKDGLCDIDYIQFITNSVDNLHINVFLKLYHLNRINIFDIMRFIDSAVDQRRVELIDELIRENVISGDKVLDVLIMRGHFDSTIQYLDRGYFPTENVEDLVEALDLEGLKYLIQIGFPLTQEGVNKLVKVNPYAVYKTSKDQLEMLDLYLDQGLVPQVDRYRIQNSEVYQWLKQNGLPY